MTKNDSNRPAPVEMEILQALWALGPCPVKLIHEKINEGKGSPRVVTTTLKLLQVMMGKRFVARDESTWPHTYRAVVSKGALQRDCVTDTLHRVFEGSAQAFMMRALESDAVSSEEIQAIRALLNSHEEAQNND